MPWKKTWPTVLKDRLKALGLKDKDIATLEGYGSLELLWKSNVYTALTAAKKEQLKAALHEAGLV